MVRSNSPFVFAGVSWPALGLGDDKMALKPCPECKAQISATADTCPQCGYSFKKRNRDRAQVGCLFVLGSIALLGAISIGLKDTEPNGELSQQAQGGSASPSHTENQSHLGPPRPIAKPEPKNIPDMPGTAKVCITDTEIRAYVAGDDSF